MTQKLIELAGVNIKIAGNLILNDLNLTILKGHHVAVTGSSGSGKSVMLQAIAGNLTVSGGTIAFSFHDIDGAVTKDHHPYIAIAGGRHHFKNLSNTSNFYYQQRYNSSDSDDALTVTEYLENIAPAQPNPYWRLDNTMQALRLVQLADKEVIKLSNGETKRLMLAAALLKNPQLLLLDNPLTGLDVDTRSYFNELLTTIALTGITIVMATSAREIPDIIKQVIVLNDGQIQTHSAADFTAGFAATNASRMIVDSKALEQLFSGAAIDHHYDRIVDMKDVHIQYGENVVLKNINWSIKPGDRWALLGRNGAGKSTLLSLINGDNPQAYANDIVLFDRKRGSGESIWDIKKKIGFVSPELYQYFPTDNSCLQVIESGFYDTLGLFRQSIPARAELAMQWMKALDIDRYARHLLKNVPASAQRLCLLARALIKNPPLLIFDEPGQGLDDEQQARFKAVIDAICRISNVTLIYVTHYQHEIPASVDKVLRLDNGMVVE